MMPITIRVRLRDGSEIEVSHKCDWSTSDVVMKFVVNVMDQAVRLVEAQK